MKKLTAANEGEGNRQSKGPLDMRSIPMDDAGKKPGLGPRFKKVGNTGAAAGGSRFKKVGVAVGGSVGVNDTKTAAEPVKEDAPRDVKGEEKSRFDAGPLENKAKSSTPDVVGTDKLVEQMKDEDVVMGEADDEEVITWEEYDFTKPTGCDHANCPGCKTTGVYEDGWLVMSSA